MSLKIKVGSCDKKGLNFICISYIQSFPLIYTLGKRCYERKPFGAH